MENQLKENEEFVSLFEYLKKPAGGDLGKQVFAKAKSIGLVVKTKDITTPRYTGKVMLYPKSFLEEYFKPKSNDDLPW